MTVARPTLGLILVLAACAGDPGGTRASVEGAGEQCASDGGAQTGTGCTLTQGYWKNHAEAWPVQSLSIGGVSYAQAELLAILRTAPRGDASLILAHQLIASLLNVASGAGPLASSAQALADAEAWMATNLPPGGRLPSGVPSTSPAGAQAVQLSAALDGFNNGNAGVPHCDGGPGSSGGAAQPCPPPPPPPEDCDLGADGGAGDKPPSIDSSDPNGGSGGGDPVVL